MPGIPGMPARGRHVGRSAGRAECRETRHHVCSGRKRPVDPRCGHRDTEVCRNPTSCTSTLGSWLGGRLYADYVGKRVSRRSAARALFTRPRECAGGVSVGTALKDDTLRQRPTPSRPVTSPSDQNRQPRDERADSCDARRWLRSPREASEQRWNTTSSTHTTAIYVYPGVLWWTVASSSRTQQPSAFGTRPESIVMRSPADRLRRAA